MEWLFITTGFRTWLPGLSSPRSHLPQTAALLYPPKRPLASPWFCTELPMARGHIIDMTVSGNTVHGVCRRVGGSVSVTLDVSCFFVVLNCGKMYITKFTIVAIYNVYSSVALSTFMLLCDDHDGSCFNQVKIVDASSLLTKYMYKKIIRVLCLMAVPLVF